MAKRFSLQRVLDYKERVQDTREGELARLMAEEQQQQGRLDRLVSHKADTLNQLCEAQSQATLDLTEIFSTRAFIDGLQRQVEVQSEAVTGLGVQVVDARESLLHARRETKTLLKLKENESARRLRHEKLVESKQLDEISTIQYVRDQRGETGRLVDVGHRDLEEQ